MFAVISINLQRTFQLCNVANGTIDPSGTLNGRDKWWWRSSASGDRADTPRSDQAKTVHERPSLWRANMALKDKAGSNVDASLSDK